MRGVVLLVMAAGIAAAVQAEVEPPPGLVPNGPADGTWLQLTAVVPVAARTTVSAQYGDLGGTRIRYGAVEIDRRIGGGFAIGAAYGWGKVSVPAIPDPTVQLLRLAATWDSGARPVELDARLWGEVLLARPGTDRDQVRARLRATFTIPRLGPALRPFVAEEVFVQRGTGFTRNRVSAGLRTRPLHPLALDLACQRSDDRGGAAQNVFLIQATWLFARPAQRP